MVTNLARRTASVAATLLVALGGLVAQAPDAPAATTSVGAVSITAGETHTCVLTTAGGVKCWGEGASGQLGDGKRLTRKSPVDVVGLTSGVAQVAAGFDNTCAVTTAGGLKCWGTNTSGQLGNGSTVSSRVPVDVVGLTSGVASVSVGRTFACAVTTAGGAKCWGSNLRGELGNGTTTSSTTPVDVTGLGSGVLSIAAGSSHACARTATSLSCWGDNSFGQLGIGTETSQTVPVTVTSLGSTTASVTASGAVTCATSVTGQLSCWGDNGQGFLGVGFGAGGFVSHVLTPTLVTGLTGVSVVSSNGLHRCAADAAHAWCWGANSAGNIGDGTKVNRVAPAAVVGLPGPVTGLATGLTHSCGILADGRAYCWGNNFGGELGTGTRKNSSVPVRVLGLGA